MPPTPGASGSPTTRRRPPGPVFSTSWLYTVVEQDMYPCDFGKPKPIAERTFSYLNASGLGQGGAA